MLRPACVLLLVVLPVLGCGDDSRPGAGDEDEDFTIPVGAEVTVNVGECLTAHPVRRCTDWDLRSLTSVSLSGDGFELGEQRVETRAALIRVKANAAGRGTLKVEFVDERGEAQTEEVRLRALDVSRTQLGMPCEQRFTTAPRAVAAGSRFEVDIYAYATGRDLSLTTGDISQVDAPGFTLTEPLDGKAVVTAPNEPGMYTWALAGGGSAQFLVFAPDSLALTLTEEAARGRTPRAIVLNAAAGATPVCVHAPDSRAVVTVTGEGCAPVLSGVEVAGPMPVRLASGVFKFELSGPGSCEVDARLPGGQGVTRPFAGAVPGGGTPFVIGPLVSDGGVSLAQPLPTTASCPASTSDGKCEAPWYLDGDCYIDSDWRIRHRDPSAPDGGIVAPEAPVGVGLTTRLFLELELGLNPTPFPISLGPPQNLTWQQDPAWDFSVFPPRESAGLGLEGRGCVDSAVLMTVTPLAEGTHGLTFTADNLDDEAELEVDAKRVDRVVYTVRLDGGTPASASPVELFIDSEATLTARYERQNGTPLHGTAPLRLETDDPQARASVRNPDALATGRSPHTLTVSSALAPSTLTLKVRDASGITGVGGFKAESVVQGRSVCAEAAVPLGEGGALILGRPPARPRVSLGGEALVFSPRAFDDGLCLEGVAPGEGTLRLQWGSADVQRVWTVTPAPPAP